MATETIESKEHRYFARGEETADEPSDVLTARKTLEELTEKKELQKEDMMIASECVDRIVTHKRDVNETVERLLLAMKYLNEAQFRLVYVCLSKISVKNVPVYFRKEFEKKLLECDRSKNFTDFMHVFFSAAERSLLTSGLPSWSFLYTYIKSYAQIDLLLVLKKNSCVMDGAIRDTFLQNMEWHPKAVPIIRSLYARHLINGIDAEWFHETHDVCQNIWIALKNEYESSKDMHNCSVQPEIGHLSLDALRLKYDNIRHHPNNPSSTPTAPRKRPASEASENIKE